MKTSAERIVRQWQAPLRHEPKPLRFERFGYLSRTYASNAIAVRVASVGNNVKVSV